MPWIQLHLTVEKRTTQQVELLLESLGALSITLGDAADEALLEPAPGELPLWHKTRVTGLFPEDSNPAWLGEEIIRELGTNTNHNLKWELLKDQKWERAWLDNFHPMKFGQRLWICPDGQRPKKEDGLFIDLDPGLAFGTGTHPTTALCLNWLEGKQLEGAEVMDFGCGSGILTVAALKLGAAKVTAIDHDPQALDATRSNGEKNSVLNRLQLFHSESVPAIKVDLIVANILAGTLIDLEPTLAAHVKPDAKIVLSGLLSSQAAQVSAAYATDFELLEPETMDGWVLLEGSRR